MSDGGGPSRTVDAAERAGEGGGALVAVERRSRLGRSAAPTMRLNLVAMIDVVFLLLIYFMLIMQFKTPERSLGVELPDARGATAPADPFALPERRLVLTVASAGDGPDDAVVRVEGDGVAWTGGVEGLRELLGPIAASDGAPQVIVRSEPGALWEHTLGAFDAARRAGCEEVRFARP